MYTDEKLFDALKRDEDAEDEDIVQELFLRLMKFL